MKRLKPINSYIRLLFYSLATGVIVSIFALIIGIGSDTIKTFLLALNQAIQKNCWIILWVFTGIQLTATLTGYFKVKFLIRQEASLLEQDEEDDMLGYRIDAWTTYTNFIGYLLFITSVILFTVSIPSSKLLSEPYFRSLPPFFAVGILLCIYNIAYVRQAQRRDPSKKGDPAKLCFNREWLESCDEAEKEITYQASYKTLSLLGWCIPVLLILALWGHIMFQTGVLSIVIVGGIWGISNLTYLLFKLKLLKTKINQ